MRMPIRMLLVAPLLPSLSPPVSPTGSCQQPAPAPAGEVLWHEAKALLPTIVVAPPDHDPARPTTLVLGLHGYGGTAEEFAWIADVLAERGFLVALPESPYPMLVGGEVGYDWMLTRTDDEPLEVRAATLAMREHLPAVVRDLRQRHAIDRVYTLGFSQGAALALLTAVHEPELFDGVVSFGIPLFDAGWFSSDTLELGHGLRVLLVHGEQDERAPFAASQDAHAALEAAGYDVTLVPFEGRHHIPEQPLRRAATWMGE